jgi:hypothetical protein
LRLAGSVEGDAWGGSTSMASMMSVGVDVDGRV